MNAAPLTNPASETASGFQALRATGSNQSTNGEVERLKKLKKACSDLESLFVNTLVSTLRKSTVEGGMFGQSAGSDIYASMVDQNLSGFLSQGQGIGLGQTIYSQMIRREGLEAVAEADPDAGGLTYNQHISPDLVKLEPAQLQGANGLRPGWDETSADMAISLRSSGLLKPLREDK